jgi:hypothetical protein
MSESYPAYAVLLPDGRLYREGGRVRVWFSKAWAEQWAKDLGGRAVRVTVEVRVEGEA